MPVSTFWFFNLFGVTVNSVRTESVSRSPFYSWYLIQYPVYHSHLMKTSREVVSLEHGSNLYPG